MHIEIDELYKYIGKSGRFNDDGYTRYCVIGYMPIIGYMPKDDSIPPQPKGRLHRFMDYVLGNESKPLGNESKPEKRRELIFWGHPNPEDVDSYVATVGSKAFARIVTLTPENIGRLEID